jgi:hypothetical protein
VNDEALDLVTHMTMLVVHIESSGGGFRISICVCHFSLETKSNLKIDEHDCSRGKCTACNAPATQNNYDNNNNDVDNLVKHGKMKNHHKGTSIEVSITSHFSESTENFCLTQLKTGSFVSRFQFFRVILCIFIVVVSRVLIVLFMPY